ncbi:MULTISPECIES: hypothetical protein [unclassified Streptomyces]|uniref:hypothetical protein n=1 Tax=unclassified Streptomyces TaxID=2593676 RepID=UPI00081EF860|nr:MULTISPECIES: hypothetical protein [unclassified Streptomyces]MYZ37509.1 hypothetical protein [Streptomyces sp. SID4917]SCF91861.1 hypothetical protein GA0115259_1048215 [Streptomyces sp. MnatMP-M17]
MNCDEPLHLDGEDHSSRNCLLKLGHPGAHEYYGGQKFPRPESAEPNPDVEDLIVAGAKARNAWGMDEMQWPIVVEVTSTYVIKAPGATEDEALKYWVDGDYPDLSGEQAIDGSVEFRRIDRWQRRDLTGAPIGPAIACPGCGRLSMKREWFHNPMRKCHGPIKWHETRAPKLYWRYRREHKATPVHILGGAA